jgi:transcriptional regulator with XRE-family HTH domain
MTPDRSTIAASVATACTESAGTVQALAEEVGVSYAALCSWSRGRRRPPPHRLLKLAEVLDSRAERLREIAAGLRAQAGAPVSAAAEQLGPDAISLSAAAPEAASRASSAAGTAGRTDDRSGRPARTAWAGGSAARPSAIPMAAAPRRAASGEAGEDAGPASSWPRSSTAESQQVRRGRPGGIPLPPLSSR